MKLNYEINWTLIRLPILPWLKVTKIEPEVEIRKVMVEVPVPTLQPVQEQRKHRPLEDKINNYPNERDYDLEKGHFRLSGKLAGTEKYRLHHARRDLIKFFIDTNNQPLRMQGILNHPNTPFKHNYVKCTPNCTDRMISHSTLRSVLTNKTYKNENLRKIFGTEEIFISINLPSSGTINGYRLSDEMFFIELNKLGLADYLKEEPKELTKDLDEKIVITKEETPRYGYQREAIDRMT